MFSNVLDTVVQSSRTGWLDATIDKAVSDMDNVDKLFSSHVLKDAVIEIQDKHKTSEVHLLSVNTIACTFSISKPGGENVVKVEFLR